MEVYSTEGSTGGFYTDLSKLFSFTNNNGTLNLYLRSTAGHTVTVNYVYTDDESKNSSKSENVKYAEEKSFDKLEKDYGYEITVSSGDAMYEVNSLNELWVTGGAENSEITVTYTPKDVIYIDQYYNNGSRLVKWNNTHITLNGPDLLKNNAAEAAVIEKTVLTDDMKDYRFLTDNGVTYDFSFASLVPRKDDTWVITDLWYKDEADWLGYHWFYSHSGKTASMPFGETEGTKGAVNFCYNKEHNEGSEYHKFNQLVKTVKPTCTEQGYTVYQCAYCTETEKREYTGPLGHQWGDWVHVDGTEKENSKHQRVCQRPGCGAKDTPVMCNFEAVTTGTKTTYTCIACGHSYTDEITPTGTFVYVYFRTVHSKDGNVRVNDGDGVTYNNNTGGWATLGRLVTATNVATASAEELGNEVNDDPNTKFERYKVNGNVINGNVGISLIDWESIALEPNGAADYVGFGKEAWHLNGTVNVYKLSYDANLPAGVKADVTVPDPAYYLPNGKAPVSTDIPELQGYDFGGWYTERECVNEAKEKVTVSSEDTVLYAKWTPAQPTADLIDDDITIYHKVSDRSDWHGGNAYADASAHQAGRTPTISYKAELDLSKMELQRNKQTASIIAAYGEKPWENLVEAVKAARGSLAMFSGSEIVLHVQLDEQLSTADIQNQLNLNNIKVTSDWFELSKDGNPVVYDKDAQSLTITCVPKDKADGYSSTITLSGLNNLSLTDQAQGELSSGTELDVISKGYIDGTIKISTKIFNESIPYVYSLSGQPISHTHELSLIGRSKEDPAQNTAKLKLATYTVTYDGNGAGFGETTDNTAYALNEVATVKANGYTRNGYTFTGWNTKANGNGDSYKTGDKIEMTVSVTLYAQWSENSSGGGGDDSKTYYYFAIEKVDAQDDHALNGAKFELYQLDKDGKVVNHSETKTRQHSSENGIALFSVSATKTNEGGDTWYYREITAPEGYVLDSTEHKIKAKNFSDSLSAAVSDADTVWNYRGTTPDLLNGDDHFAYVVGYQDGCVHPDALITRAETATIFFRLLKDSVRDGNLLTSNTFADVPNAYWANTAISTMAGLGIVQGYNSTAFDPNASITRAEFAAICARFDTGKSSGTQTFSDIKGHWAEKYIERAAELGWIKGLEDGTFRPNDCITRAQAMTMINRVLNRIPEDASDLLPDMNVWPDCNPGDWFYLAVQEATNSHDFKHKAGNYETWISMKQDPDWTRYEN